jgi:hypothetical protein
LSVGSLLRSSYLRYFSQPAHERNLYQALLGRPFRSIVEIGLDLQIRTPRLFEAAATQTPLADLRYTGIDQFDARTSDQPRLLLKQAHAALRPRAAKIQLVPGDPATALSRVANSLAGTDLLLISLLANRESLAAAWTWVPRMLNATSLVLIEQLDTKTSKLAWRQLSLAEIQNLATAASKSRRLAA